MPIMEVARRVVKSLSAVHAENELGNLSHFLFSRAGPQIFSQFQKNARHGCRVNEHVKVAALDPAVCHAHPPGLSLPPGRKPG